MNLLLQLKMHSKSSYSILPSQAINFSKSLFGSKTLKISKNRKIKVLEQFYQLISLFKIHLSEDIWIIIKNKILHLEDNFRNKNTMYQLKYFLSCIMTLPTYYFDAIGHPCYKEIFI